MSRLSIFNLDILQKNGALDDFHIIDFNGARGGLGGFSELYGDDRVQEKILKILADYGNGEIRSLSMVNDSLLQHKFSSDVMLEELSGVAGVYNAFESYMPVGDPYSTSAETPILELAQKLGIDYRRSELKFDERIKRFQVTEIDSNKSYDYQSYIADRLIWPYSLDQRNIPEGNGVFVNSAADYILASNKFIFSEYGGLESVNTPKSMLCGHYLNSLKNTKLLGWLEQSSKDSNCFLIKPISSLRSFGVCLANSSNAAFVLEALNLITKDKLDLECISKSLLFSLLWGDVNDLLVIAQPFIEAQVGLDKLTNEYHRTRIRATIVLDGDKLLFFDAYKVLLSESISAGTRSSFISVSSSHSRVSALPESILGELQEFVHSSIVKIRKRQKNGHW